MSTYGVGFDRLAERWAALEAQHDLHHPDRDECGGVGGCSMMFAATGLEQSMIKELESWRLQKVLPLGEAR